MSIGFPANKTDIDNRAGGLAIQVRDVMGQVTRFQAFLAATPDANLVALGYTQTEVNNLKSAFTDLKKLADVYGGTATQATVYDFQTFAKLLTGVA